MGSRAGAAAGDGAELRSRPAGERHRWKGDRDSDPRSPPVGRSITRGCLLIFYGRSEPDGRCVGASTTRGSDDDRAGSRAGQRGAREPRSTSAGELDRRRLGVRPLLWHPGLTGPVERRAQPTVMSLSSQARHAMHVPKQRRCAACEARPVVVSSNGMPTNGPRPCHHCPETRRRPGASGDSLSPLVVLVARSGTWSTNVGSQGFPVRMYGHRAVAPWSGQEQLGPVPRSEFQCPGQQRRPGHLVELGRWRRPYLDGLAER